MATLDKALAEKRRPYIAWALRRPGYWRTRRILEDLKRFQDLARHYQHLEIDVARPLQELITGPIPQEHWRAREVIERQLNELTLVVVRALESAGIRHDVTVPLPSSNSPDHRKDSTFSVIFNFVNLPANYERTGFDTLMQRLQITIGWYEDRKWAAMRDWCNPLFWMGIILRSPITAMEYAGLVTSHEEHSQIHTAYLWVMRTAMLLLLFLLIALLAKKLAVSIPWDTLRLAGA